jgi:orotidine-5'-phosphate decarboxylase
VPTLKSSRSTRQEAVERLIIALDVPNADLALRLAEQLRGRAGLFKVGLELFSAEGPALIRDLVRLGCGVFLDLKFHDIPNTVRGAAREAVRLGVTLLDVHASGGRRMMEAALEGVREGASGTKRPLVLGVTILTSLAGNDLVEIGWDDSAASSVILLSRLAHAAGLSGVVASAQEAEAIRGMFGRDFIIVTPGIRPAAATDDQARVSTPEAAIRAGADYLVVGRPITQAPDPTAAAEAILEEIGRALNFRGSEVVRHGRA